MARKPFKCSENICGIIYLLMKRVHLDILGCTFMKKRVHLDIFLDVLAELVLFFSNC